MSINVSMIDGHDDAVMQGDLISRSALLKKVWDVDCRCGYVQVVDRGDIEEDPAVDAVEVVRCRDFKHRYQYEDWDRQAQESIICHECKLFRLDFGEDGFCSRGERRDGE